MSASVTITFTSEALAVLARFATLPERVLVALKEGLDEQNQYTVAHIIRARLTGKGPFPPDQGRLGVRTGLLRRSVRATPAIIVGQTVTATIGTNVKYAGVHEFGGTLLIKRKPNQKRLRTAKEIALRGSTYKVTYPERAPIRNGIEDKADDYTRLISRKIIAAV